MMALALSTGGAVVVSSGSAVAAPDGCTLAPDESYLPVYYNFTAACNAHDICYEAKRGGGSEGRRYCDDLFRADMKGWCNSYYTRWYQAPARLAYRGVADIYYQAVRAFGGGFF